MKQGSMVYIAVIIAAGSLAACVPPDRKTIDLCRAAAISEARGHELDSSDIGELTESCMMTKGYLLKEEGPFCSDNFATATNPHCYYRNNLLGRVGLWFSGN